MLIGAIFESLKWLLERQNWFLDMLSREGQFNFFSAGIAGSLEDIYLSIFCYKTYTFNQGPEALNKAKV